MTVWEEFQGGGQARWSLPLILSALLHVFLLQMLVPAQEAPPPRLAGSSRMTVILAGPVQPEPAAAIQASAPEPEADLSAAQTLPEASDPRQEQAVTSIQLVPTRIKKPMAAGIEPALQPSAAAHPAMAERGAAGPAGQTAGQAAAMDSVVAGPPAPAASVQKALPLTADNRPPAYPALARKRGWQGQVVLVVEVGCDGAAQTVRVERGSGYPLLDEAAREAVRRWRFQPGTRDGEAVVTQVLVPVHFVLEENA